MLASSLSALTDYVISQHDAYGALALHAFVDEAGRARLDDTLFSRQRNKLLFAAAHYTPASVLDRLADEPGRQIALRLVKHPNTAADTLQRLYRDRADDAICPSLAAHRNALSALLAELGVECLTEVSVRSALCSNTNTPLQTLSALLTDSTLDEKKLLARNPSSDENILQALWNVEDEYVLGELVANPSCSEEMLREAAQSQSVFVRRKLASNPAIDMGLVLNLLSDESDQVRAAIARNQEVSERQMDQLCDDPSRRVRRNQAQRESLPAEVLLRYAQDTDPWVRRWVARNPAAPSDVLDSLANDEDENVRRSVARNLICPDEILARLAIDKNAWVRAGVALRADLSDQILQMLMDDTDIDVMSAVGRNPGTATAVLEKIARHENRDVRRSVIFNRQARQSVLVLLKEDPYPLNRILLAGHPQSGMEIRSELAKDPDSEVRFSAIRALSKALSQVESKTH